MKFIENIKQRVTSPSKVVGIECLIQPDSTMLFHLLILERKQDELVILKQSFDLSSFDKLKELVNENNAIHLTLNGKGILHKKIKENLQSDYQFLQSILPNAETDDFVIEQYPITDGVIGCIIRKEIFEKILLEFQQAGLWVTSVSLGSFDVKHIVPFIEGTPTQIFTSTQIIEFNGQQELIDFSKNNNAEIQTIDLGGEKINSRGLVAYAGAFKSLMNLPTITLPQIDTNREEFFHQQIFKKAGVAILSLFFITLVGNAFFYYHFKDKNQEISSNLFHRQGQLNELDSLRNTLTAQEALFKATDLNQNSKASFYSDRIAASVPKGIQFSLLEIFPSQEKEDLFGEEELQKFAKDIILVKGFCKSSLTYNQWIKKLKELDWIKEVNHLDYKDVDKQLAEFELKLTI